jgi:hypothetical protein
MTKKKTEKTVAIQKATAGQAATSFDDLPTSTDFPDGQPRTRDIDLGKWLGYRDALDCRELVKRLIKAKKLNDIGVYRVAREAKMGHGHRMVDELWLTRDQAIKVTVYSDTEKGDEMLNLLIAVFDRAIKKAFTTAHIEARLLERANRRVWEKLWGDYVIDPICKVLKWPTKNKNGGMYAPLSGIMKEIYIITLGREMYEEIKYRNKKPVFGSNHHQLLQKAVCDMLGDDLKDVATIAGQVFQTGRKGRVEFLQRLRKRFCRGMVQADMWE